MMEHFKGINMVRIHSVFLSFFLLLAINLQGQQFLPLWPEGKIPNSKGIPQEHLEDHQRIRQVSEPGLYTFFTAHEENTGRAVLICPSGGYGHLTYNLGGFQLAKWLNSIGINAFVLIYRLPHQEDLLEREQGPVQDAQRAMKIIRANAVNWNIDTGKVGIMGTSAGGHLASTLGTHPEDFSVFGDSLDDIPFQPDFMILVSPVISMGKYAHAGSKRNLLGEDPSASKVDQYSNELHVSKRTPPAFLVHAQDDQVVPCENSILFFEAMVKNGVGGSLHIFPHGGHKIGLVNNPGTTQMWTDLCAEWLGAMDN